MIVHIPLRSVCNGRPPVLHFHDKNAFAGRQMVKVQLSRSWLKTFEASEQMRKDDQVLMHKGWEAKTPVTINPLLFQSNYLCPLVIL